MKKKNSWLNNNIKRITWLDHYTKPEKVDGAIKLDSNENFALDKDFVASVATEAAKQVDLREYPLCQIDELYAKLATYVGVSGE
jgi:histidinol-phosphate aminotransferase